MFLRLLIEDRLLPFKCTEILLLLRLHWFCLLIFFLIKPSRNHFRQFAYHSSLFGEHLILDGGFFPCLRIFILINHCHCANFEEVVVIIVNMEESVGSELLVDLLSCRWVFLAMESHDEILEVCLLHQLVPDHKLVSVDQRQFLFLVNNTALLPGDCAILESWVTRISQRIDDLAIQNCCTFIVSDNTATASSN